MLCAPPPLLILNIVPHTHWLLSFMCLIDHYCTYSSTHGLRGTTNLRSCLSLYIRSRRVRQSLNTSRSLRCRHLLPVTPAGSTLTQRA